MPLNMRILTSRDPDGRIAEAIKKGQKVNSSDYSALCTHSRGILSPHLPREQDCTLTAYASGGRVSLEEKQRNIEEYKAGKKAWREKRRQKSALLEEQKDMLADRTAKRRAKRQRRSHKAE